MSFNGMSQAVLAKFSTTLPHRIAPKTRALVHSLSLAGIDDASYADTEDEPIQWLRNAILYLPNLRILQCSSTCPFDIDLPQYTQHARLEELDLTNCGEWLTEGHLRRIADIFPNLIRIKLGPNGMAIRDGSISQLSYACHNLSEITLVEPRSTFSDVGVLALAKFGKGRLRVLKIQGSNKITDHSLEAIAIHCYNLEELDISHCTMVTMQGLEKVITNREKATIRCLALVSVRRMELSLTFLEHLARHCPDLEKVSLSASDLLPYRFDSTYGNLPKLGNVRRSGDPPHPLLERLSKLQKLSSIDIYGIDDDECPSGFVLGMLSSIPNLKFAHLYKVFSEGDYLLGSYTRRRQEVVGTEPLDESLCKMWIKGPLRGVSVTIIESNFAG